MTGRKHHLICTACWFVFLNINTIHYSAWAGFTKPQPLPISRDAQPAAAQASSRVSEQRGTQPPHIPPCQLSPQQGGTQLTKPLTLNPEEPGGGSASARTRGRPAAPMGTARGRAAPPPPPPGAGSPEKSGMAAAAARGAQREGRRRRRAADGGRGRVAVRVPSAAAPRRALSHAAPGMTLRKGSGLRAHQRKGGAGMAEQPPSRPERPLTAITRH